MATDRGPIIRLQGGPHDRWAYYEQDFFDCIRAAQRMGRSADHPAGWALTYERPMSGLTWVWRPGQNCHPNPID
jgi:hypothetical protein